MDKPWDDLIRDSQALGTDATRAKAVTALTGRGETRADREAVYGFGANLTAAFGRGKRGAAVDVSAAATALGRSPSTVRRWLAGTSTPTAADVQRTQLAVAYGADASAAQVAARAGVTTRTAKGWLAGTHHPNAANQRKVQAAADQQLRFKTAFAGKTDAQVTQATGASLSTVRRWRAGHTPGRKYQPVIDQQVASAQQQASQDQVADRAHRHLSKLRQPVTLVVHGEQGPPRAPGDTSYHRLRTVRIDVDPLEAADSWSRGGMAGFGNWLEQQGCRYVNQNNPDQEWTFTSIDHIDFEEDY